MKRESFDSEDVNPGENKRVAPRIRHLVKGRIETGRLAGVDFLIRDISSEGLGGRCDRQLRRGEKFAVLLPEGSRVPASVAWAKGHLFGLVLHEQIDPSGIVVETRQRPDPHVVPSTARPSITYRRPGFSRK